MSTSLDVSPDVVVVVAASAGGIRALLQVLSGLSSRLRAAIVIVQHRKADKNLLNQVLGTHSNLPVENAVEGSTLLPGHVYVAPADRHLSITRERQFATMDGRRIRGVLSSANPLFESAADAYGVNAIAVVLSGAGLDGTDGVQAVRAAGGVVIAQDESTSLVFGMPRSAIASGAVDYVLPIEEIAHAIEAAVAARRGHTESANR